MNWKTNVPPWITLPLLAGIVIGVLALVANVKAYLDPVSTMSTIYRPKPVPVPVETVKWLTKTREVVKVPVEVVREVPPKTAKRLEDDFHLTVPSLLAEHKELLDVANVPRAPHGGEMALTLNTETGKVEETFRATAAPVIEFGGVREVGLAYDAINRGLTAYYQQDLVRLGPAIVNVRAFATAPLGSGIPTYGATVGVAARF